MASENQDALLTFLLGFAQKMLPKREVFSPFGAKMTVDGIVQPVAVYQGDRATIQSHLKLLIEGLRLSAQDDNIVSIGICTNCYIISKSAETKTDSVKVHLEDRSGECVDVFLPYHFSANELILGKLFAVDSERIIF